MTTLESTIDADTEALHAIAEAFPNIDVVYKAFGDALPYRWEVQTIDPPKPLGEILLNAMEICLLDTERRKVLRLKFLNLLKQTGHDH
jgi:hypothetical protein